MLQQNWKQKEQFWYILDAVSITVDKKKSANCDISRW